VYVVGCVLQPQINEYDDDDDEILKKNWIEKVISQSFLCLESNLYLYTRDAFIY